MPSYIHSSRSPKRSFSKCPSVAAALFAILRPECLWAASEAGGASTDEKNVSIWLGIAKHNEIIAVVVGIAIAAGVLQRRDYTDASITVLSFLVPLVAFCILKSNESPVK